MTLHCASSLVSRCKNANRWVTKATSAGRAKKALDSLQLKDTKDNAREIRQILSYRQELTKLTAYLYNASNTAVDDCRDFTEYNGGRAPNLDTHKYQWAKTNTQYDWFQTAGDLVDTMADGNVHLPKGSCEYVGKVWKCVVLSPAAFPQSQERSPHCAFKTVPLHILKLPMIGNTIVSRPCHGQHRRCS